MIPSNRRPRLPAICYYPALVVLGRRCFRARQRATAVALVVFSLALPAAAEDLPQLGGQATQLKSGVALTSTGGGLFLISATAWMKAASLRNEDEYRLYEEANPGSPDPCKAAQTEGRNDVANVCQRAQSWRTAGWLSLGAGVATSSAGLTLLLTGTRGSSRTRRTIELEPVLKSGGAAVRVRLAF